MKLLFVHDHQFYKKGDRYYSGGNLSNIIWNRYIRHFESIEVVARGALWSEKIAGISESTHEKVTFNLLYEVSGGKDYFTKSEVIKSKLKEAIKRADAIIIRFPSSIGLYCAELCTKLGKPYSAEVVGCIWDASWNYGQTLGKLVAPYLYLKTRKAIKESIASIYVTQFFLQTRYPNLGKLTTYASNVIIDNFSEDILNNHINLIYSNKTTVNLGLIGSLNVKYKGYDTAMKALSVLKKEKSINLKLNLVGGGDDGYVKQLAQKYNLENSINIIGRLKSGSEVFRFLDTLDIYIHPSKQEGLPRSVIEAMGRGCPVLASSVAGIPELLDDKYLHKPGDHKMLAKQLLHYLTDPNGLVEMSKMNFAKSKEYTNEILTERRDVFLGKIVEILSEN